VCAAAAPAAAGAAKAEKPLNIVFVSAEVAPWSKTGGLGDVVRGQTGVPLADSLPRHTRARLRPDRHPHALLSAPAHTVGQP
jgi:hypothetical protein